MRVQTWNLHFSGDSLRCESIRKELYTTRDVSVHSRSPHSGIGSLRGALRATWLLFALAIDAGGQAPIYVSRVWRTQDGLPENRVRTIAQTPDGYLWLGTSSGLARFDGVRFMVYA